MQRDVLVVVASQEYRWLGQFASICLNSRSTTEQVCKQKHLDSSSDFTNGLLSRATSLFPSIPLWLSNGANDPKMTTLGSSDISQSRICIRQLDLVAAL